jgi:hypothetical protein
LNTSFTRLFVYNIVCLFNTEITDMSINTSLITFVGDQKTMGLIGDTKDRWAACIGARTRDGSGALQRRRKQAAPTDKRNKLLGQ